MSVSIKDIARLAGVSHSTVSRALHDSPLIPTATARRIQQIAAEIGYSASAVARSLVTRKTHAIGVVVTSIADPFNGEVVGGMEEVANQHGYSVILATSQADPERELMVVRSFRERRVDGIVVASSRLGANYLPLLAELNVPIVLLNNQHPSKFVHSVTIDNVDGGYKATRHLLKLGHREIGYIGDQTGLQSDAERFLGFERAMSEAGARTRREFVVRGDGRPEGGRLQAAALLSLPQRPSALFCYNDMTALGVLEQAARMKLEVPRDLSVVGFDDLFFATLLQPALTTVRQPKKELGQRAVGLVIALLKGEKAKKKMMIRGELVVRGSSSGLRSRLPIDLVGEKFGD